MALIASPKHLVFKNANYLSLKMCFLHLTKSKESFYPAIFFKENIVPSQDEIPSTSLNFTKINRPYSSPHPKGKRTILRGKKRNPNGRPAGHNLTNTAELYSPKEILKERKKKSLSFKKKCPPPTLLERLESIIQRKGNIILEWCQ